MTESVMHDRIERVSKALPVVLAALYVAGFIIVAFRLAGYGASSLDLFRIQYVAAGFWFGIACSGFLIFAAAARPVAGQYLFQKVQHTPRREFLERLEARDLAGTIIGNSFLVGMFATMFFIGDKIQRLPELSRKPPHFLWFLLTVAGIDVCIHAWLLSKARNDEGTTWSYEAHFCMLSLAMLVLLSLQFFARDVYPALPFPIGGGETRQVAFWLGPQSTPAAATTAFLERDGSSEYTIPYELLLENESSYVVISPKDNQRSIEFERKAVEAMVVLGKRPSSAPANFQRNLTEPSAVPQKSTNP